jgi:hypothetical protein
LSTVFQVVEAAKSQYSAPKARKKKKKKEWFTVNYRSPLILLLSCLLKIQPPILKLQWPCSIVQISKSFTPQLLEKK